MMMVAVVLLLRVLVVVDVEKLHVGVHLMRDEALVLVALDNEDDVDDHLLDSDQIRQDMYIEFVDQFEFVLLWMHHEIQNEVFHLKPMKKRHD